MEFTEDDLRLIMAVCLISNPQYPDRPVYPAWEPVFSTAAYKLRKMIVPVELDEYECLHYDDGCRCLCLDCKAMK